MSDKNKSTKEKRWKNKSKAFRKFVIKNKDVPPQHKELFPEEYMNQLYESPLIFFEQLPNIISSINNGEYIIYDHAGINLFTHYIYLYETKSEREKIYKEKFIDFFQQAQPIITNVYNLHWKTNETFLYDLIKRKNVLFCFDIITPLIEQGIIDDKIMTLQNKDGFTFLYLFYQRNRDYLFKDESSSISQKFKMLFTLIYEKDSYTINQLFPTKII